MKDVGFKIKNLREEAGMTQLDLALKVNVSSQVISNIERGYTTPKMDVLNSLANVFNVPADYLLGITTSQWMADSPYSYTDLLSLRINKRMDQLHLSMEDLSVAAEVDLKLLMQALKDGLKLNVDNLARIAEALETSMDYLIGKTDYWTISQSEDEQDLILFFRSLTKKEKRIFLGNLESSRK